MRKIVKSICNLCRVNCGINVHVENNKILKVERMEEHPLKMPPPEVCLKPLGIPEWVHSKDRILRPLRNIKGEFREIGWNEAFSILTDNLSRIKEKYGAKSLVVHFGTPFIATQTEKVARRFNDLYGTPNYTSGSSFCFYGRVMGYSLTSGSFMTPNYGGESKCMIIWGNNPKESTPLQTYGISKAKKEGAKLIVVDPRKIPLAKQADLFLQVRPGADGALALSMLHMIIKENLYDKEFVERWTVGFDDLVKHVQPFTPEWAENITWVKADTIRKVARTYATSKPASLSLGISIEHQTNGIQTIRAIAILIAITGNLDVAGGNTYPSKRLNQTNLRIGEVQEESIGAQYPIFSIFTKETTACPASEVALRGKPYPIKALIVHGSNPTLTWPNTNKFLSARDKLEFVAVIDLFLTDTAKIADLVLPATTFLERMDLREYRAQALSLVAVTEKAIEPLGESMEDWKIWAELGRRMGFEKYFPWQQTEDLFEYLLEQSGVTLEQLKKNPGGIFYAKREFRKYLKEGFNTPSGKVEVFCERLKEYGYEALPAYHEPAESPLSTPDTYSQYPLILITGARINPFYHTMLRNIPVLRRHMPEPLIEIHPDTAAPLGIADGDWVKVESLRGSIRIKAVLSPDIHPNVVSIPHGWTEANANLLTDDMERDPISAYPGFRSILCRVKKDKM